MTLVRYESSGLVATITMDRASSHNALNNALCDELREAWLRFRDSDDRVAVLAAAEEAYFSVGADVKIQMKTVLDRLRLGHSLKEDARTGPIRVSAG